MCFLFLSQQYLCENFEEVLFHWYLRKTNFKKYLVSFFLTLLFLPPLVLVFSKTFIKLSLSSEGWENFSFKKESLPTSWFYIFPQALNSLIFFPFKNEREFSKKLTWCLDRSFGKL